MVKNTLTQKKKTIFRLISVEVSKERVRNAFQELIEAYQKLKMWHDDFVMARDLNDDDMVNVMYIDILVGDHQEVLLTWS